MVPPGRRSWFPHQLPPPQGSRSLYCLAAVELIVPCLLGYLIKPIRSTLVVVVLIRFFCPLIVGGYARDFRGWYTATHFPSVDLQQLCDSYHGKGEMNLPRELIDEIMRYSDLQTLKKCSLTSRTFYSAARPFIHKRMALGVASAFRGSLPEGPPRDRNYDQADVFHARYLSAVGERGLLRYGYIREVHLDLSIGKAEKVLQLQQLRALETVHTLTIGSLNLDKILPIFDLCFSQFVPTLRSLRLDGTHCENAHQLMEFICRFPHLDDLALATPRGLGRSEFVGAPPGSEGPQPQRPLPFGGHLVLDRVGPFVQCLLDLPGGIRFRSIEASIHLKDLEKLLVACSSTLEVLNISCLTNFLPSNILLLEPSGEMISVNLVCNGILRRFEFVVDFPELDILPPFLHKTLTSISSPHFSEFSLQLRQGLLEFNPNGDDRGRRIWGTGWELVDEDLYACAARTDNFQVMVEFVNGQSTEVVIEAHFPRMKSRGSLKITQEQPWW